MDERDVLIGATVAGRYLLQQRRRSGAESTSVFDATDSNGGRPVIVRLLTTRSLANADAPMEESVDASIIESFQRQLLSVAGISHPVLVSPLDWGEASLDGTRYVFVVTEKIDGVSVRELLDRGRRLSPSQALVIGLDLCRALHHLHQNGLVHGDLRPANVFVTAGGRARLAGIGVKRGLAGPDSLSIEQARYAAPEFAPVLGSEELLATPMSDMYALSLTVLEMITGEVPFAADSLAVTLANRAGKLLPVSADIGPIAAPLEKAARPEPGDRSTAIECGQAFAQLAGKMPPPEPIEALEAQSFRETISQRRDTVTLPVTPREVSDTPAVETPITVDVAVVTEPRERRRYRRLWSAVAGVAVVVTSVLVWQVLSVASYEVPNLIGVAEGEARNSISPFGWTVLIQAERSDDVELGVIIRTEPSAGESLRSGAEITLVVSEGATLAVLPEVTGLPSEEAKSILVASGLVVNEVLRDDDSVPVGRVVSWIVTEQPSLVAGSEVLRGTQVAIVVSGGPVLRSVPNLIGLDESAVQEQLAAVQLVGQRNDDVFSGDIPVGLVASQDPRPDAQLARNGVVAYSLSKGVDNVEVPNVIGLSLAAAQAKLIDAGLTVGDVSGRSTGRVRSITLDGNTLRAGDQVPRNSAVNLIFP